MEYEAWKKVVLPKESSPILKDMGHRVQELFVCSDGSEYRDYGQSLEAEVLIQSISLELITEEKQYRDDHPHMYSHYYQRSCAEQDTIKRMLNNKEKWEKFRALVDEYYHLSERKSK